MSGTPHSSLAEMLARPGARVFHGALARIGAEHIGRLVAAGVLVPEPPLTGFGPCGCEVEGCVRAIARSGGHVYSVCPHSRLPNEEITEEHLRSFTFRESEWLRRFAEANGLAGEPREYTPRLLFLGSRACPGTEAAVLLAREIRKDELLTLRMTLRVKHTDRPCILLVPRRPHLDEGDHALLALGGYRLVVLPDALRASDGLRIEWPACAPSRPSEDGIVPRLVLYRNARKASLDGAALPLQRRTFALLLHLAENATPELLPIPSASIFEAVWETGSAADVDYFEGQVNDHVSKVRKAFRDALGLDSMEAQRLLFNEKGKGFGLAIPPERIRIA